MQCTTPVSTRECVTATKGLGQLVKGHMRQDAAKCLPQAMEDEHWTLLLLLHPLVMAMARFARLRHHRGSDFDYHLRQPVLRCCMLTLRHAGPRH